MEFLNGNRMIPLFSQMEDADWEKVKTQMQDD